MMMTMSLYKVSWVRLLPAALMLCVNVPQICGRIDLTTCGERNAGSVFLVHRGIQAQEGSWPWHATIFRELDDEAVYLCGGSILDNHTILTAAHCFFTSAESSILEVDQISVHVGRTRLSVTNANLQVLKVAKIVIHPEFRPSNVSHDIAIVQLSSDISFTHSVRPVCLWSIDDDQNRIVGKNGTVIGFGLNEKDELSETLQEATLTVVDVLTCILKDRAAYGSLLGSNMFCAGGKNNVSACNGDSGGGMFFHTNGTWYLRGVVSFMPSREHDTHLCDSTKYTVFTDASKYREWILRYTDIAKWRKELKPCQDGAAADDDAMCNAASRYDHDFFLLVTPTEMFRLSWNGEQLNLNKRNFPRINYDCAEGHVWAADRSRKEISVMNYDGTDEKIFTNDTEDVTSLAVDWISRRLYWGDTGKNTIEVAALENPHVRTILFTDVKAWRIAVDPVEGKLYYMNGVKKIEWSNLDGSQRQILVKNPDVEYIYDIKVYVATGELCYFDRGTRKIDCIDTRTKRIRTIVNNLTSDYTYLSGADELLYWIERDSDEIKSIDQYGVRQKPINFITGTMVVNLEAVAGICPIFHTQCAIENGGCPKNTICLLNARDPSGKICKQIVE